MDMISRTSTAVLHIRALLMQRRPCWDSENSPIFGFFILLFIVPLAIVFISKDVYHDQVSRRQARRLDADRSRLPNVN